MNTPTFETPYGPLYMLMRSDTAVHLASSTNPYYCVAKEDILLLKGTLFTVWASINLKLLDTGEWGIPALTKNYTWIGSPKIHVQLPLKAKREMANAIRKAFNAFVLENPRWLVEQRITRRLEGVKSYTEIIQNYKANAEICTSKIEVLQQEITELRILAESFTEE
jgi:hypothetical protein